MNILIHIEMQNYKITHITILLLKWFMRCENLHKLFIIKQQKSTKCIKLIKWITLSRYISLKYSRNTVNIRLRKKTNDID